MQSSRRTLMIGAGVLVVGGAAAGAAVLARAGNSSNSSILSGPPPATPVATGAAAAVPKDPRLADRALGAAGAPVTVAEWFSLTCPHCARFAADVLPTIRAKLIDTGRLRYVFKDFPLDQVALTAAMVARSLPVDRYEPFCGALLASQDRWAFARGVNSTEELARMAALAGLPRERFDAVIADDGLRAALLAEQDVGTTTYKVDSTPTFIFNGPGAKDRHDSGEMSYDSFAKQVAAAAGA